MGRQILFYGDSNTYGYDPADPYEKRYPQKKRWVNILSGDLSGKWDILCDGMNGRRLPDLRYDRERLNSLLGRIDPGDVFAMMLGTNDILLTTNPNAVTAIQKMASFLSYLCIQKRPEDILVIAPPYIASENTADPLYRRYYEESLKMNEGFCYFAKTYDTGFLDAGPWNVPLCFDMVHFSEKGHRMFAEKIRGYLKGTQP